MHQINCLICQICWPSFFGFMILQVYMLNGTLSLFLAECSLPLQITRLGINSLFEAEETSGISCKTYASLLPTLSCQLWYSPAFRSTLICPYKEQYLSSERLYFLMEKKPFWLYTITSNPLSSITVGINCLVKKIGFANWEACDQHDCMFLNCLPRRL